MKKLFCCIVCLVTLLMGAANASEFAPVELSGDQAAAVNLFLSNFTEIGMDSLDAYEDDSVLVDFAHDHQWFNAYESFEYGEYFNDNNCRVSDERIADIIEKYFYYPREVDLSQTRFDYKDGYYYHCETGGWTSDGFAHTVSFCPIGEDKYFVSFYIFGGGDSWDNSVMGWSLDEVTERFGHPTGYGSALIYAENPAERSTYRMISFARV